MQIMISEKKEFDEVKGIGNMGAVTMSRRDEEICAHIEICDNRVYRFRC